MAAGPAAGGRAAAGAPRCAARGSSLPQRAGPPARGAFPPPRPPPGAPSSAGRPRLRPRAGREPVPPVAPSRARAFLRAGSAQPSDRRLSLLQSLSRASLHACYLPGVAGLRPRDNRGERVLPVHVGAPHLHPAHPPPAPPPPDRPTRALSPPLPLLGCLFLGYHAVSFSRLRCGLTVLLGGQQARLYRDRKSTRLNSSHANIS